MNDFFTKIKRLNRKRNIITKKIKVRLQIVLSDSYFRKRTSLDSIAVKNILIVMAGKGIGDAIVMTGLIRALSEYGYKVSVLSEPRISHIFENLSFIDESYVFCKNKRDEITFSRIKDKKYDIMIDLDNIDHHSLVRLNLIKKCKPAHTIGINQFARLYDTSLTLPGTLQHISSRHIWVAKKLNVFLDVLEYTVCIDEKSIRSTALFLNNHKSDKIIVINPYGTEETRDMSITQINELCYLCHKNYGSRPFIIGLQSKIIRIPDNDDHIKFTLPEFQQAAALVKSADIVISTDTSIVHLCKAMNKKLVCIYNNKISQNGEDNNILWAPDYDNAIQILSPGKRVDDTPVQIIFRNINKLFPF